MSNEQKPRGLVRPGSGRHAHASPSQQLPRLDAGSDDPGEDTWDEYTPILDSATLYRKVAQTASMVKKVIEVVPAIQGRVDLAIAAAKGAHEEAKNAHAAASRAQTEAFDAKNASVLVQQRMEDVCHRVDKLEPLQTNGAATKTKIEGIEEQIKSGRSTRTSLLIMIVGIIVTGLGSLGTAIWWAGQLDSEAVHEVERREAADRVLDAKLADRPTRDEVLTRDELKTLRDELKQARRPTVDEWIESLPPSKRALARKLVSAGPTDAL